MALRNSGTGRPGNRIQIRSMLNGGGGCILLGVKSGGENARPEGELKEFGLEVGSIPHGYCERLEEIILTGIAPAQEVCITSIKNEFSDSRCFIAINIPAPSQPIYSVIKDGDGNDAYEIWIRSGRNKRRMDIYEMLSRVRNFEMRFAPYREAGRRIKKEICRKKRLAYWLKAYPAAWPVQGVTVNKDKLKRLPGGETASNRCLLELPEDSEYMRPTVEGMRYLSGPVEIEIHENQFFSFTLDLMKNSVFEFIIVVRNQNGGEYFLLNHKLLQRYVEGSIGIALDWFRQNRYYGKIELCASLMNIDRAHLAVKNDKKLIELYRNQFFSGETRGNYYGPNQSERDSIEIQFHMYPAPTDSRPAGCDSSIDVPLSADIIEHPVDDSIWKKEGKRILDYFWRGFNFERFPYSSGREDGELVNDGDIFPLP